LAPRKYPDPRGKQLIRVFGWEWVAVSLLMYLTIAVGLHTHHDRAAMIVFYAILSLSILCSGAYGFIYQSVTGDKRAKPLRWALLLFCVLLSALFFALNVIPGLKS
jgi:hypothetical protein